MIRQGMAGLLGAIVLSPMGGAKADPADWTLPGWSADLGSGQLDLGAEAGGTLFTTDQPRQPAATGYGRLKARLHRDYDSGLSLGLDATLSASDPLSRGRYGDGVEKIYGEVRTGLGRLELGQTDGAAYALAVTGPKVDAAVSLDDAQTSLLRDPSTGRAFNDVFALRSEVGASSNDAKFAYISPALFGAQLALSFTPNQAKEVLPFLHAGPHVPGRQADIWEAALRYSDSLGPFTLTGYAGLAEGRAEHKLPGQEGVSDWALGLLAEYPINDDWTLSAGGAWRQSNAHAFDIDQSWQAGGTQALHASAMLSNGAIMAGVEYGNGEADTVAGLPRMAFNAYQASIGYVVSPSIQISAGWQDWTYTRSSGTFFNGAPRLSWSAGFLHLTLHTGS